MVGALGLLAFSCVNLPLAGKLLVLAITGVLYGRHLTTATDGLYHCFAIPRGHIVRALWCAHPHLTHDWTFRRMLRSDRHGNSPGGTQTRVDYLACRWLCR